MNIEMTHVIILFPNRRIQATHQLCIFVIFFSPSLTAAEPHNPN